MKMLFITLLVLLCKGLCAQNKITSGNPVIKGWYADPEAIIINSEYWIYPTWSDVYEKQVFFDAFSSPDLITWTKHSKVLDTSNVKWARRAVWAPAIVEKGGKYYLFFGANDIQNNNEYGGIGVAVADHPEGPFKDLIGKPLIDKFYNGAQPIDQFVLKIQTGNTTSFTAGGGTATLQGLIMTSQALYHLKMAQPLKK